MPRKQVSYTHLRFRIDYVSLGGLIHRKGSVVEIESLDLQERVLKGIDDLIDGSRNQHRVFEAGSIADGEFVPLEMQEPGQE